MSSNCSSSIILQVDGLTREEHEAVISRFEELLQIDPSRLLPKHRHFFDGQDFEELGTASTTSKQYWIYSVESALAAAAQSRNSRRRRREETAITRAEQTGTDAPALEPHPAPAPALQCEQGIKYKKRRMK